MEEPGEMHTVMEPLTGPMDLTNSVVEDVPTTAELEVLRKRHHHIPAQYYDTLPISLLSLPQTPISSSNDTDQENDVIMTPCNPGFALHGDDIFQTAPNIFGLFRRYRYRPSYDPDAEVTLEDLAGFFPTSSAEQSPQDTFLPSLTHLDTPFYPFPNMSTFMLSEWYYNSPSGQRSGPDFNRLIAILSDERFKPEDLIGFNASVRDKLLDQVNNAVNQDSKCTTIGGWTCNVPLTIQIPEGKKHWTNDKGQTFTIPGLHHRSITEVIQSVFEMNTHLHFTPFELWWQPGPNLPPQRIYSDITSSQAFHDAYHEVNQSPDFQVPGCTLEKTVAPIMVYSDSTHLAQFGTAKLWPIYAFAGNLDKWFRLKPSTHSCEHWAYIPSVSDWP
jgi:hypothetical protein